MPHDLTSHDHAAVPAEGDHAAVPGEGDEAHAAFREAVYAGLSASLKTLPCKYLYDERGSALFDEICALPEYYPTRTETAILQERAAEIADAAGRHAELVELGSGASVKSRILLSALDRPARYVPLDISVAHMEAAAEELRGLYPGLAVTPVAADFTQEFRIPRNADESRRVLFFPGSTIGNFDRAEAERLLARLRRDLDADLFVVSVDLIKDKNVLHAAYNDSHGVTAAFNINLLARINRELDGTFDLARFKHHARTCTNPGRVEMHLVSLVDQQVRIGERAFSFEAGETIHTENSNKYAIDEFTALTARAGWTSRAVWTDTKRLFSVHLLTP